MLLKSSQKSNLKEGVKSNGIKYSVRDNRDRFFFPDEWMKFNDCLRERNKTLFDFLINTGCRINEALNVKTNDCDLERGNILLRVTKVKAKKGEKNPRPRIVSISSQFARRLKKYIADLNNDSLLFNIKKPATHIAMKTALVKAGIKDPWMFSLHNIRKTHGNYLKALGIDGAEICVRLGHDYNTFIKSYGSPDIFTFKDKQNMRLIIGDLYLK